MIESMRTSRVAIALAVLALVATVRNRAALSATLLVPHKATVSDTARGPAITLPVLPQLRLPILRATSKSDRNTFELVADRTRPFTLLVAFTYGDCYKGLGDIPFWSEIQERYRARLRVVGVTTGGSADKLRYFIEHQELAIPVYNDSAGRVFDAIYAAGYLTPAMVLIDSTGAVIRTDGGRAGNAPLQASLLVALDRIIGLSPGQIDGRNP
jgi:hypothetical protein